MNYVNMMRRNKEKFPRSMFLFSSFTRICAVALLFLQGMVLAAWSTPLKKGASGLPIPRFVSLKVDEVNVRKGPSTDHKVVWIYRKEGLPVEIIAEFENWRQVRDSEGNEGWVFHALLSGRRTALISPWEKGPSAQAPLYRDKKIHKANVAFIVEAGILANVLKCSKNWCKLSVGEHTGWIKQEKLWGVYRKEDID